MDHGKGRTLPYTVIGSGAHPLLLVPGALGLGMEDMTPILDTLDQSKYTMIAVNLHGCYPASSEREWTMDAHFEDALDCHTTMMSLGFGHCQKTSESDEQDGSSNETSGIHKPYSVLGWCNGATTGLIIAAKWPSSVRKLIVSSGKARVTNADVENFNKYRDFDAWLPEIRKRWMSLLGERRGCIIWLAYCDLVQHAYEEKNGNLVEPQLLANIACRTLVLHGDMDGLVPSDHVNHLRSSIRNVQVYIWPDGKHNLHFQKTEHYCTIVHQFLNDD